MKNVGEVGAQAPRNLAGLTKAEQDAMNQAGLMLLREMLGKTRSHLDADWLALCDAKKVAVCAVARQSRAQLVTATLSALPTVQREAIRLAVIALEYQGAFRDGCDSQVWHPVPATRAVSDIEREKRERAAKLRQRRTIAAAIAAGGAMSQTGQQAIGQ